MFTIEIFLAVFIFILLVLVSIEDALTGFLLLLMLVPLQHKEFFSLVYWDVLPIRIAFFGLILTTGYRSYLWFRRNKDKSQIIQFLKDPVLILIFSLYFVRLISLLFAENLFAGVKLLAFYTVIVYFYILMKHLYLKHGNAFIEKSMFVYVLSGIVTALIALIQFFSFKIYDIKFGAIWDIPGHNPRIGSTFWDVNHYGAFIASIIPISLLFIVVKSKRSKVLWVFSTLFLGLILYLTQSRSAWLGLAIALSFLIVMLFIKGFKKYAKYAVGLGLVVSTVFIIYAQVTKGGVVNYYKQFMHTRLDSFDTHFILLRGAYESYIENPIIGAGYGNFNEAFRKTSYSKEYFFREKNIVDKRVPSHSLWGEVISETGFLGLAFYILTFFTVLSLLFRGFIKTKGTDSLIPLALFTSILAVLISGVFYTYNLEFFWFITFLGVITGYQYNRGLNLNKYFDWLFSLKNLPLYFLSVFAATLVLWDLSKNKLIDWDEAIYGQVARNIVETGRYLTLYWGDLNTPWFEKPPLFFWISSFFMGVFGVNAFTVRAPSALLGFLSIIVVYFFAKYAFKSRLVGLLSGLMLITTADYWYYSRLGMTDVSVSFFILASLYFIYRFFEEKKQKWAILSGIFTGFAVMTKAIVGLLPIPIIGIFLIYVLLFQENTKQNLRSYLYAFLTYTISFLFISMPWHLYMYFKYGQDFIDVYIKEHILGRGLSDAQGKTQPFFYYVTRFKPSMRGWYLILIPAIPFTFYKAIKNNKNYIFFAIYSIVVFLFFSISTSKLIWYIIPIYPALCVLSAAFVKEVITIFYNYLTNTNKLQFLKPYITYKNIVGIFSIIFSLTLLVYITTVQQLVFYPDFNKDRVKVIEAYNENYVEKPSRVSKLYFLRMDYPVVRFYAKGPIVSSDTKPLENEIRNADFGEALAYISRQGEVEYFVKLLGNDRVVPSYKAGAYSLMYIRSLEEFYLIKVQELTDQILQKSLQCDVEVNKSDCRNEINTLKDELYLYQKILNQNMPQKYLEPILIYY